MEIKILGPGCPNCKILYALTQKIVDENKLDANISKVDDIVEIMSYNIISTPAIVIDGQVVVKGRVPTEKELKNILMPINF